MELKEILIEIFKNAKEEGLHVGFPEFVNVPGGQMQKSDISCFDYEYVDQYSSAGCEDCYHGWMYYPWNGIYIKVSFSM